MTEYAPIHPERPLRRAVVAFAIAALVHAALLTVLGMFVLASLAAARKAEAERPKEVALAVLDAARWEENRGVAKEFVPSAAFDTAAAELARPAKARFLSDRDRRAERETVAPPAPGMPGRGSAAPAMARQEAGAAAQAVAALTAPMVDPLPPAPELDGPRPAPARADLQPKPLIGRPLMMNFDVAGQGGVPELDGVAVGNLTVLNAEAWRYATFFDRVGETLYGVWRVEFLPRPPVPSVAAQPRGGAVRVALGVTLDASGRAVEVTVRRSSGLPDVDALLAELVRSSAPFPNVPTGLLDAGGRYSDIWIIGLVWGWRGR